MTIDITWNQSIPCIYVCSYICIKQWNLKVSVYGLNTMQWDKVFNKLYWESTKTIKHVDLVNKQYHHFQISIPAPLFPVTITVSCV